MLDGSEKPRTGSYVAQAPLAIVVAIQHTKFAVADASRAIQSMILTGWSDGVGSNLRRVNHRWIDVRIELL